MATSHLTWVNELDQHGKPIGYDIYGEIVENDGTILNVVEFSHDFDRSWGKLRYYIYEFKNVNVQFKSIVLGV